MRYTRFTVAVATAGAGVICLAPATAADEATPEPGTAAARESGITLGPHVRQGMPERARNVEIIPCVRVGVPAPDVEIIPCVRVGVIHVAPSVGVGETNPPDPVRPGGESAALS